MACIYSMKTKFKFFFFFQKKSKENLHFYIYRKKKSERNVYLLFYYVNKIGNECLFCFMCMYIYIYDDKNALIKKKNIYSLFFLKFTKSNFFYFIHK